MKANGGQVETGCEPSALVPAHPIAVVRTKKRVFASHDVFSSNPSDVQDIVTKYAKAALPEGRAAIPVLRLHGRHQESRTQRSVGQMSGEQIRSSQ